jgi:hypothetical protein
MEDETTALSTLRVPLASAHMIGYLTRIMGYPLLPVLAALMQALPTAAPTIDSSFERKFF